MATGDTHTIFIGTTRVTYKEYKLQAIDRNKSLKQIAWEQLGDEKPAQPIYRKRDEPNASPIWAEVKDPLDANWTLLLPPTEYASFTIKEGEIVRTSTKIENTNILYTATPNSTLLYKKNSVVVDTTNGMVWADVSKTDPRKNAGKPYWICVKYGNSHRTVPPINGPSS